MAGAPKGNKNAIKAKIWSDAIRKVAVRADGGLPQGTKLIERAAMALWEKGISGDVPALKELGDRLEGKVPQAVEGGDGKSYTVILLPNDANL